MRFRSFWIGLGAVLALILLIVIGSFFADRPLRSWAEQQMNRHLKGYKVELGGAHFNPVGFSLDLKNVTLYQEAHPDPPVAQIPLFHASVHWRALLHARVVGDIRLDRPVIRVNRTQTTQEAESSVPIYRKGWQDAILSVYPLKIDVFRVTDGSLTYLEAGAPHPLRLDHVYLEADNIRNIRVPDRTYPSEISLSAVAFDAGRLKLDGNANFLAEPHVGVKARVDVQNLALDYFRPILARHSLIVRKGVLSLGGSVEYGPNVTIVDLETATVDGIDVDYRHTPASTATEKQVTHKTVETTKQVSNKPGMFFRAREVRLTHATVGYVDESKQPGYRVFLSDVSVVLSNFTNQLSEGPATAAMTGKLMGSGNVRADATFRPETSGPNFDLAAKVENTDMAAMNPLWRAFANIEVEAGTFSLYSEMTVRGHAIHGYVKPLMSGVQVVHHRKAGTMQKVKEKIAAAASKILRNRPRREVVTVTDISGTVESPQTSVWQVVTRLIQNAFFRAILPGFLRETREG